MSHSNIRNWCHTLTTISHGVSFLNTKPPILGLVQFQFLDYIIWCGSVWSQIQHSWLNCHGGSRKSKVRIMYTSWKTPSWETSWPGQYRSWNIPADYFLIYPPGVIILSKFQYMSMVFPLSLGGMMASPYYNVTLWHQKLMSYTNYHITLSLIFKH